MNEGHKIHWFWWITATENFDHDAGCIVIIISSKPSMSDTIYLIIWSCCISRAIDCSGSYSSILERRSSISIIVNWQKNHQRNVVTHTHTHTQLCECVVFVSDSHTHSIIVLFVECWNQVVVVLLVRAQQLYKEVVLFGWVHHWSCNDPLCLHHSFIHFAIFCLHRTSTFTRYIFLTRSLPTERKRNRKVIASRIEQLWSSVGSVNVFEAVI